MALTAVDRALLQRCLNHEPGAWNDFVDRFLGLLLQLVMGAGQRGFAADAARQGKLSLQANHGIHNHSLFEFLAHTLLHATQTRAQRPPLHACDVVAWTVNADFPAA